MNITIEKKRNPGTGNPLTVISNINHNPKVLENLAKELKSSCGAGGYVKGKSVILQGSHTNKVKKILTKKGYTFS